MNHKRGRAKNQRAGCLWCKPWKMNGWGKRDNKDLPAGVARRFQDWRREVATTLWDAR